MEHSGVNWRARVRICIECLERWRNWRIAARAKMYKQLQLFAFNAVINNSIIARIKKKKEKKPQQFCVCIRRIKSMVGAKLAECRRLRCEAGSRGYKLICSYPGHRSMP